MARAIQIGIVGDYRPEFPPHPASTQAIQHAAQQLNLDVKVDWIGTQTLDVPRPAEVLEPYDGLFLAPYSPYKSRNGAQNAVRFARTRGRPFVAT